MEMQRRDMLKGLLASGAVVTAATVALSEGAKADTFAQKRKVTLLVSDINIAGSFTTGIKAAKREGVSLNRQTMDKNIFFDPKALSQTIATLKGHSVVGLMSDTDFILFNEMLRDAGSQVLCVGQHVWGGSSRYDCSHEFVSGSQSRGIGAALSDALSHGSIPHAITESPLGLEKPTKEVMTCIRSEGHWAAMLGQAMGRIVSGDWQVGPVWSVDRPGGSSAGQRRQSAVSFAAII